ncbi:D-ribitol-5-phosphate cytidylyltransferase [Melanotaenia boesemani]|uniref:D-ribitol-5-phosphate cytidylyltransferase n=1 Tax=Melanotaenia boesemani TaxID=1250792 RepID=UPI001C048810|nr:D-ribitol-5-phosphate cytidylyltransferase [Melanotaenia boesemani]XP_041842984.1 D-ribitol-5-phosphate cytidylyltransferase [Melanotaenia boesemani]XP_041842985.1 D-ribitol-5-phosphate cytidylyltransferase [Melanotaenia boesemani]
MEVSQTNVLSDESEPARAAHPGFFPTCEAGKSDHHPAGHCVDFPVSVVLPAGGTGERTGLQTPKQFCSFLGRPLISYTIQAFERVLWIQSIVVAVAKENMDLMMDIIQRFQHKKVRVVSGGSTRHRSICNGVLALGGEDTPETDRPKVLIIHDAVRPFVEEDFLYQIVMAAKEQGAAGAIRPLVSTVIATTSEGYLDHSLERAKYRASEMPQGFTYDVIYQAYQRCTESDFEFGTECLHLALQYCGTNAKLIEGPPTLWKVTYKRDLAAAESIIKETLSQSACFITGGLTPAVRLADALQKAIGALDMELDVIPDLMGDNARYLFKEWNFIQVSINHFCLSEVEAVLGALQVANRALLHPLVVIWVCLRSGDELSISSSVAEPAAIMDLASTVKLQNILLYSIQLHQSKDTECWERSASRVAEIASALIRERSPALVGQLLQA